MHFLVLGALLFFLFRFVSSRSPTTPKQIIVTQERVAGIAAKFSSAWGRPPDPAELQRLIDDYVRQEILCREAMSLGFDRDDPLIRSQLVQNVQIIPDELAAQHEPTDNELKAFIAAHPDAFAAGRQVTFWQVFLNPEYHRGSMTADAAKLKEELALAGDSPDLVKFGDPYDLPHALTNAPSAAVTRQFGESFTADLFRLPAGEWQGPIASRYGQHLVRVRARHEGHLAALDDVRRDARQAWMDQQRNQKREEFYNSLRSQFSVALESTNASTVSNAETNRP